MKVKDAIKALKELDQNEEIIIAWWEQDNFNIEKSEWTDFVQNIDDNFDWSSTHEDIENYILTFK